MESVRIENYVPFTSTLRSVAFINIKCHLPGEFPLGYRIKATTNLRRPTNDMTIHNQFTAAYELCNNSFIHRNSGRHPSFLM